LSSDMNLGTHTQFNIQITCSGTSNKFYIT